MARRKNQLDTATITISTTPPVERMLERLVETGLFGKNTAEATERIVTEALRRLWSDPTITDLIPESRKPPKV